VPDLGKFADFEASLSAQKVAAIREMLEERKVALLLPKFSFEQEFSLAETLQKMGMPAAFEPGRADFSGMDGEGMLAISDVFHKAFVTVDEKGTEAAAATAVIVFRGGLGPDVELTVDRPFVFIILDQNTGSVLFVGRVLDPSLK
jgi:serpin B